MGAVALISAVPILCDPKAAAPRWIAALQDCADLQRTGRMSSHRSKLRVCRRTDRGKARWAQ